MKALRSFLSACLLTAFLNGVVQAQTFTNLYSFAGITNSTNFGGASPVKGLILAGNTLYGAVPSGGTYGEGVVFKINTNGTGFTVLHNFAGSPMDGAVPYSEVVLAGNTLYGTTRSGGATNIGSVYRVNTDGTGFTNIYSFSSISVPSLSNADGAFPLAGLVVSGNVLYGAAYSGGASGDGTIFKLNNDGTGFVTLYSFNSSMGSYPEGTMVLAGANLYGAAAAGGANGNGVIFSINTNGSGFNVIYNLDNTNGIFPNSILTLSGASNVLYGTAPNGGAFGHGTVFSVSTNGANFTTLYNFDGTNYGTPNGGVTLSGSNIYGASTGGSFSNGMIFSLSTNGTGFTNLYSFPAVANSTNNSGVQPVGPFVLGSNVLFGLAASGGAHGEGTIFGYTLPSLHPAFFNGEVALDNGVYYLQFTNGNIFGYYTYAFFPYLYHYDLGFEYFIDANDSAHGAYLYDFTSGHFWYTSPVYPFPYLYDFSLNAVLYYYPNATNAGRYTANPRYFYNTATSNIFTQ